MVDPTVPGSSPIQPTPSPIEKPSLPAQEAGQQKPFTLGPEPLKGEETQKLTPMEAARERGGQPKWSDEQMQDKLEATRIQYEGYAARLKGPEGKNLTPDHFSALDKLQKKLNPDLKTIAEGSGRTFSPEASNSPLTAALNWFGGAQDTFGGALNYLGTMGPNMNMGDFMKMQYATQRAAQRGELFASIIGSTVSGIKTLMSTQLG